MAELKEIEPETVAQAGKVEVVTPDGATVDVEPPETGRSQTGPEAGATQSEIPEAEQQQAHLSQQTLWQHARQSARQSFAGLPAGIAARPKLSRWILAGPGALIAALLFMMSMPIWFPEGAAGVNHIILPLIFAPLFWAIAFAYTCIEENLPRCAGIISAAIVLQSMIVAGSFVV